MPILRRRCVKCAKAFDLLSHRGVLTALDHPNIDHIVCPECGGEGEAVIAPSARDSMVFPYFDRGLGCEVRDRKHHRWLMKHEPNGTLREAPLIQTHGELDTDDQFDAFAAADQKVLDDYKAQQDEMMNGPARHDYARLHDFISQNGTALWED